MYIIILVYLTAHQHISGHTAPNIVMYNAIQTLTGASAATARECPEK